MSLGGVISSAIGMLNKLKTLKLGANNLTGNLPNFSTLTSLEHLYVAHSNENPNFAHSTNRDVSGNRYLSGPAPSFVSSLANLTHLYLHDTDFSGALNDISSSVKYLSLGWPSMPSPELSLPSLIQLSVTLTRFITSSDHLHY